MPERWPGSTCCSMTECSAVDRPRPWSLTTTRQPGGADCAASWQTVGARSAPERPRAPRGSGWPGPRGVRKSTRQISGFEGHTTDEYHQRPRYTPASVVSCTSILVLFRGRGRRGGLIGEGVDEEADPARSRREWGGDGSRSSHSGNRQIADDFVGSGRVFASWLAERAHLRTTSSTTPCSVKGRVSTDLTSGGRFFECFPTSNRRLRAPFDPRHPNSRRLVRGRHL